MAQARGRSGGSDDGMARLAELLETVLRERPMQDPERRFKAPEFDGSQDVDLFIRQFQDVSRANQWDEQAVLLNLRKALKGKATDCGSGRDPGAILAALRLRFGITARQARDKLRYLVKDNKKSWHEFGDTVEKLVNIAYAELPAANRVELALDFFSRGIENRALQRHLLAVPPNNIPTAVRIAEEFMQVGTSGPHKLNAVGTKDEEGTASVVQPDILAELLTAVKANSEALEKLLKRQQPRKEGRTVRPDVKCYNCGGNHLKRDCKKNTVSEIQQENEEGPQDDNQ